MGPSTRGFLKKVETLIRFLLMCTGIQLKNMHCDPTDMHWGPTEKYALGSN
jgi:hypothetical protein